MTDEVELGGIGVDQRAVAAVGRVSRQRDHVAAGRRCRGSRRRGRPRASARCPRSRASSRSSPTRPRRRLAATPSAPAAPLPARARSRRSSLPDTCRHASQLTGSPTSVDVGGVAGHRRAGRPALRSTARQARSPSSRESPRSAPCTPSTTDTAPHRRALAAPTSPMPSTSITTARAVSARPSRLSSPTRVRRAPTA